MFRSLFACLILSLALPIFAMGTYSDTPTLPDKPSSVFVKPLFAAVNTGDIEQMKSFIEQHFAADFLQRFPMQMHINFMLDAYDQHGEVMFHSARSYANPLPKNELVVIFKSAKTEQWGAITIFSTPEKPYKIAGLRLNPARTPSNIAPLGALTIEQAIEELDNYVTRLANRDVFSGTVLLAKQENVLFTTSHGMASKRFNVPNNLQTKFNLGSMNKMFTSVAIMQLIEAGKLSLNDKLSKFADESWLAKDVSNKIEIRHLLSHSSGLGNYFNQTYAESSKNTFRALEDYKPLIIDETLQFEPGTSNRYSNTGMFMLGVVIEKVSGQDYFSYIREHIYTPAGMTDSGEFEMDQPVPNLAIGYAADRNTQSGWRNNLYTHVLKGGPAGGGFSTVEDLHRFALALTQFKLLNKTLTEQAYSAKPELHAANYGYGFHLRSTEKDQIVGHSGGFHGISSNLDIYLKQGYIAAVMSNYSNGARPIEAKIRQLLARVE